MLLAVQGLSTEPTPPPGAVGSDNEAVEKGHESWKLLELHAKARSGSEERYQALSLAAALSWCEVDLQAVRSDQAFKMGVACFG